MNNNFKDALINRLSILKFGNIYPKLNICIIIGLVILLLEISPQINHSYGQSFIYKVINYCIGYNIKIKEIIYMSSNRKSVKYIIVCLLKGIL